MNGRFARGVFLVMLLPCEIAASIGVYTAVELAQNGTGEGEYAGLAPYVVALYFGPGFLAAGAALLFGIRPGKWRFALTAVAALWTAIITPMLWMGGVA